MFAAALLSLLAVAPGDGASVGPGIGDPAPALDLTDRGGRNVQTRDLLGKTTVVEFFATWCGPCRESLDDLVRVFGRMGDQAPRLILIDAGEPPATVDAFLHAFLRDRPLPAGVTVIVDRDARGARGWRCDRLPTTYVVDAQAIIRHINRGHGAGFAARLERWLAVRTPR